MTVTAICTLDEAYDWLNQDNPSGADDYKLQQTIDAATAFIQFETGPIIPQDFTETHSGGGPKIILCNPPILTVTSVTEYIGAVPYVLTQVELGSSPQPYSFSVDEPSKGILTRRFNGFQGSFLGGPNNIIVVYTAGLNEVPGDVKLAALEDIRGLYTQTQYGGDLSGIPQQQDDWTQSALNPIIAFPRLAALLQGPTRVPGIA